MAKKSPAEVANDVPSVKRGLQEGYSRATFILKDETIYKLGVIASFNRSFLKKVANEALEEYVSAWEKKNPTRKIPKMDQK
jgi:hypothetical protein